MQSQQKKVKWSRGETADALEERTDTGITQVSVSKMENIIADIYGNISRRPALKIISSVQSATRLPVISGLSISSISYIRQPQSFVFTIDANTYIIFIVEPLEGAFGGLLIQNNKFVKKVTITNNTGWTLNSGTWEDQISAAQYNNFMVVSNIAVGDVIFRLTETNDIVVEKFQFSAPWYAPNGTQTRQISSNEVTGLDFDAGSIGNYTYTEANGETTVYSWISTGINHSAITGTWTGPTTTYYVNGMHPSGWPEQSYATEISTTAGSLVLGSFTMTNGQTYTSGQKVGSYTEHWPYPLVDMTWDLNINIRESSAIINGMGSLQIDVSNNLNIPLPDIVKYIPVGSIVQFPNNGSYMRVEGFDSDGTHLRMYGALLVPIVDDSAHDSIVKVETGYVSLQTYTPTQFMFSNQRLYAAGFYNPDGTPKQVPGYAVGSQIARYNDFKNDYNTQNEALTIDINTPYQEQIVSMADYNGLKLFTDSAEYSYNQQSGIIKQSNNGSLATCKPLVFGSVCLYADKSGSQIRAMQYELQTDLFNSSSINQMCKEDLIFNTNTMAGQLDKEHYTGRFLYATQTGYTLESLGWGAPIAKHSLAVCNFVPGNQAQIWARWTGPEINLNGNDRHSIVGAIEVNNKVWFIMACDVAVESGINKFNFVGYTLAELDYESIMDAEATATAEDTQFKMLPSITYEIGGTTYTDTLTMPGATVSVFDGDQYMWDDTLDENGNYTKPLTDLTNPRVGFMINAELVSHPIDVGGKTYTDKKRIGKAVAVIRDTDAGAFTVCDKTGYTSPDKKTVSFYGCTGMKDQVRYTIKNIKGAKFSIESLTMIIEYGTLES